VTIGEAAKLYRDVLEGKKLELTDENMTVWQYRDLYIDVLDRMFYNYYAAYPLNGITARREEYPTVSPNPDAPTQQMPVGREPYHRRPHGNGKIGYKF
jgi:hypothetical protein